MGRCTEGVKQEGRKGKMKEECGERKEEEVERGGVGKERYECKKK